MSAPPFTVMVCTCAQKFYVLTDSQLGFCGPTWIYLCFSLREQRSVGRWNVSGITLLLTKKLITTEKYKTLSRAALEQVMPLSSYMLVQLLKSGISALYLSPS